jgi:hypothetical protein
MNMRAPTIKAFSHANLVGCTVSVSRLMSRRSLRTGASIFQIYLSTGQIFVPKVFWFLAMWRILFFVLCLPWSPWLRILLLPHLIRLQVSAVQSTSIGIALPLSFKLLRYQILIGKFGYKVSMKKRAALKAWAPSNALLWGDIAPFERKVPPRQSRQCAF